MESMRNESDRMGWIFRWRLRRANKRFYWFEIPGQRLVKRT